jgi:two-component system, chemotaxis family, CheB/CheR fusion protein
MDPQPARPLRVLAVDDHRDTTDSASQMLTLWGHRPLVAHDAAAAWEMILAEQPDVVLLDIGLPGLNGWELAHRLRAEPLLSGLVLIAVTGYGQAPDLEKSRAAGIDHHLLKPVDPDLLREMLAAIAGSLRPLRTAPGRTC